MEGDEGSRRAQRGLYQLHVDLLSSSQVEEFCAEVMPVSEGSQACGVLGFAPSLPLSCGRVQKGFFTFWSWDQPVMERGA